MTFAIYENYLDATCYPGTTFAWQFQLVPLDITGGSASLVIDDIVPGTPPSSLTLALTCTPLTAGSNPVADLDVSVAAGTTASWLPGVYDYRAIVTFSDGSSAVVVTGMLLVKKYVVL